MNQVKISAKTVDEAVKIALQQLGAEYDDVEIEVTEEPTKGLFGLGGKDATVVVTVIKKESISSEVAKEFIDLLIGKMKLDCQTDVSEDENAISIVVSGPDVGGVIGRRGETLDAIQYLVSLYVNKGKHGEGYKRVMVDSENYRAKREETLIRLANSMAQKALKRGRNMVLEPMNPYERRIIHSTLQSYPGIVTRSIGEEPNRKIVISIK